MNLKIKVSIENEDKSIELIGYEKLENNYWYHQYLADDNYWRYGVFRFLYISPTPKVIRQISTGLFDINGEEIYLEDKIKTKYEHDLEAIVKFDNNKFIIFFDEYEVHDLDKENINDFGCFLVKN